jgi:hypothetical protein
MRLDKLFFQRAFAIARIAPAAAFIVVSAVEPAMASSTIITKSCGMLKTIKDWLFGAAYILGAIGLVLIAVSAFLGRFKFAHLISLGGGLFIVAMADYLIDFATDAKDTQCKATKTTTADFDAAPSADTPSFDF